MRTLYLIFAHDHQEQLTRLAHAIRQLSPSALIAVHFDPTNQILDTPPLLDLGVSIVPDPVRGEWGDYSLVEQYLHAMRWCYDNLDWEWLCTLTGLTYPINPIDSFEKILYTSEYDAFIRFFDALTPPDGIWPNNTGEMRYAFRYYKTLHFPYYYKIPKNIQGLLHRARLAFNKTQPLVRLAPMPRGATPRIGIRRIEQPLRHSFKLQGGRQMLNVNRKSLLRLFQYLSEAPSYEAYFKTTLIPDEGFFTTYFANDRNLNVCNNVMRFIKWGNQIGASSVSVITRQEVDVAIQSRAPFALKLDSRHEPAALDYIDARLGLKPYCVFASSVT